MFTRETCLFLRAQNCPASSCSWRGDPHSLRRALSHEKRRITMLHYGEVHTAEQPGAIRGDCGRLPTAQGPCGCAITLSLTFLLTGSPITWIGITCGFRRPSNSPKPFGIDNTSPSASSTRIFSEFIKYMIQRDAERCSQPAMILAGLHEAQPAGDAFVGAQMGSKRWMRNGGRG